MEEEIETLKWAGREEIWAPSCKSVSKFRLPAVWLQMPLSTSESSTLAPGLTKHTQLLEAGSTKSCFDFSGKTVQSQTFPPKNNIGREVFDVVGR